MGANLGAFVGAAFASVVFGGFGAVFADAPRGGRPSGPGRPDHLGQSPRAERSATTCHVQEAEQPVGGPGGFQLVLKAIAIFS